MVITGTEIVDYFSAGVFPRLQEIVHAPLIEPTILWTILPLLITAFFLELYFGRYKIEELGWNSAFANCISLLWVTTAVVRFMYELHGSLIWTTWDFKGPIAPTMLLIGALGLWALTLAVCNFFHILPKWIAFFMSSTIPVNVSAVLITVIVIGKFPMDRVTATATLIAFVALAIVFSIIQAIVRPSAEAKKYIEDYKKKAEEQKKQREQRIVHQLQLGKERILAQYHATVHTMKQAFGLEKKTEKEKK